VAQVLRDKVLMAELLIINQVQAVVVLEKLARTPLAIVLQESVETGLVLQLMEVLLIVLVVVAVEMALLVVLGVQGDSVAEVLVQQVLEEMQRLTQEVEAVVAVPLAVAMVVQA
jgi:hypothetical protein